jgi:flagella synthesis protein FlgN
MTSFQQLHSVLKAEYTTATQLLEILSSERSALVDSDSDVISQSVKQKQPLIYQLEQLGRQRESILQAEGFPAGKEGLEACIANQAPQHAQQLQSLLKQLREVAKACRDNNQINGEIVNVNRQYLHSAMRILRGQEAQPTSYGPGGEYTNAVVRQPLIGRV